jgi:hypothetical protein
MNETHNLFIQISLNRMYEHYLPKLVKAIHSINREHLWAQEQEQEISNSILDYKPDELIAKTSEIFEEWNK